MALALLCSQVNGHLKATNSDNLTREYDLASYKFLAFIVDHAVREGSDKEAQSVAKVLQARGMDSDLM
jgi:hypothetical protein